MAITSMIQETVTLIRTKTNDAIATLPNLKKTLFYGRIDRQKTAFIAAFFISLCVIVMAYVVLNIQIDSERNEIRERGKSIAMQFPEKEAAEWLGRGRSERQDWQIESLFKLKAMVSDLIKNGDVRYALIVDEKSQEIKAHTVERFIGSSYQAIAGEAEFKGMDDWTVTRYHIEKEGSFIDFAYPIFYGKQGRQVRVGVLHYGLSFQNVDRARARKKVFLPFISIAAILTAFGAVIVKDQLEGKKKRAKPSPETGRLGPYVLERKIATGGMAELFVARKEMDKFKMRVAIKRILPEKSDDARMISALFDEANLVSQLRHPNIVTLLDFGKIQDTHFIAMEYIDGASLASFMEICRDDIETKHALHIIAETCKGLQYAHGKKDDFSKESLHIVHRDISPQNILISFDGEVKIVDFGIARAAQRETQQTRTGIVKGKLSYMSPEQAKGEAIDHRSDLFSVGMVFYELLAGEKAYQAETMHEMLLLSTEGKVIPIHEIRKDLPEDVCRIVMKTLATDPLKRHQTAEDLRKEIMEVIGKYPDYALSPTELSKIIKGVFKKNNV